MDLEIVPAEILSTRGCPQTVEKYYPRVRDEKEVLCIKRRGSNLKEWKELKKNGSKNAELTKRCYFYFLP